ncbi:hypothetical protein KJ596_03925 [Patescibacteria group bacterium]|nr:hypothetical protein [Patescibacteria group bacterium]MBU1868067.1 hypothetical protein [Patescibacteria group bacterium]
MYLKSPDGRTTVFFDVSGSVTGAFYDVTKYVATPMVVRVGDKLKVRSHSHACFPYFGTPKPGGPFQSLDPHGFLRQQILEAQLLDPQTVQFGFQGGEWGSPPRPWDYQGLLAIRALDRGLSYFVKIENYGALAMPFMFAWHLYLCRQGLAVIGIDDEQIRVEGAYAKMHSAPRSGIVTANLHGIGTVNMLLSGAFADPTSQVMVWTDWAQAPGGAGYVCCESLTNHPDVPGLLPPGGEMWAQCVLQFVPLE